MSFSKFAEKKGEKTASQKKIQCKSKVKIIIYQLILIIRGKDIEMHIFGSITLAGVYQIIN